MVRLKAYQTLSEAMADQAHLVSLGIKAELHNTQDIHPTLIGQVFLMVPVDDQERAKKILSEKPDTED